MAYLIELFRVPRFPAYLMETKEPDFVSSMLRTIKCYHCSKLLVNQQGLFYAVKKTKENCIVFTDASTHKIISVSWKTRNPEFRRNSADSVFCPIKEFPKIVRSLNILRRRSDSNRSYSSISDKQSNCRRRPRQTIELPKMFRRFSDARH